MTDAGEGIADDLRLEGELPRVIDVRVQTAATEGIPLRSAPVGRWFEHANRLGESDAFLGARDNRRHTLAGNRPGEQQHLSLVPRDHPSAGCRLFDQDLDLLA